jgi:hydroxypyruvate reductase
MTPVHSDRRALLRAMFDAAVRAAHPDNALARHFPPPPKGRVIVLAAGKGAAAMAAAAERYYLDTLAFPAARFGGIATTRHGHGHPTRHIKVVEAGHPVPDSASVSAATETLAMAQQATADDLVLVLLSGGGSANWVAPADGLSLVEKQALTRALLRSGAPIGAINCVRKHLSKIKGGRLARAAWPATLVTLAISDVPGDDPSVIASGPTVADPTTLADAQRVLADFGVTSAAATAALAEARNESPKPGDAVFAGSHLSVVATPRDALAAAAQVAADAGYEVVNLGSDLQGEARDIAAQHAALAQQAGAAGRRAAIVSGGELTVTLRGNGRGGPNQEYALALLTQLGDLAGIHALAADTDGADGGAGAPTDPAGAFVDVTTATQSLRLGLDPADFLTRNDATGFFERAGGLLVTGPTLTNVNDLRVILIDPA